MEIYLTDTLYFYLEIWSSIEYSKINFDLFNNYFDISLNRKKQIKNDILTHLKKQTRLLYKVFKSPNRIPDSLRVCKIEQNLWFLKFIS